MLTSRDCPPPHLSKARAAAGKKNSISFLLLTFSNYSYYVGRMGLNFVSYIQMIYPFNKFIIKNDDFAYFRRGLDQNFNGVDIARSLRFFSASYTKVSKNYSDPLQTNDELMLKLHVWNVMDFGRCYRKHLKTF